MSISVKFTKKLRQGKMSLWVNEFNIWDLPPKQVTTDVVCAIQSAVERGMEIYRRECDAARPLVPFIRCDGEMGEST